MDPVSEALRTAHAPTAHEPLRAQALQVRHRLCLCGDLFIVYIFIPSQLLSPSLPSDSPPPLLPSLTLPLPRSSWMTSNKAKTAVNGPSTPFGHPLPPLKPVISPYSAWPPFFILAGKGGMGVSDVSLG